LVNYQFLISNTLQTFLHHLPAAETVFLYLYKSLITFITYLKFQRESNINNAQNYPLSFRQHFAIASAELSKDSKGNVRGAVWSVMQTAPQRLKIKHHTHNSDHNSFQFQVQIFTKTSSDNYISATV